MAKTEQVYRWTWEASCLDKTARTRTQGSFALQDPRRTNLEDHKTDAWCIAPEGARTWVTARTSSLVSIAGADHPLAPSVLTMCCPGVVHGWENLTDALAANREAEMLCKALATIAAAAIMVAAFAVPPADAKKGKKGNGDRQEAMMVAPSLDGRITGRARTCGHDTFVYDVRGIPRGPYCH
jgi:hypothetical protein